MTERQEKEIAVLAVLPLLIGGTYLAVLRGASRFHFLRVILGLLAVFIGFTLLFHRLWHIASVSEQDDKWLETLAGGVLVIDGFYFVLLSGPVFNPLRGFFGIVMLFIGILAINHVANVHGRL